MLQQRSECCNIMVIIRQNPVATLIEKFLKKNVAILFCFVVTMIEKMAVDLHYPFFGPTRLAGPNRIRDALIPLYHFIKIIYQKHAELLHFSWHKSPFKYAEEFLKGLAH